MKERFFNKRLTISLLLCVLPVVFYLPFYGSLPEPMPVHFNSQGIADGFLPKAAAVFLLPLGLGLLHLVALFITFNDPKKANSLIVRKRLLYWIIPVLSAGVNLSVLFFILGKGFNISLAAGIMVGLLLVITGNYLPKCRQNYTVGIKLPWTLSSQENWDRTHRVGGWCFIAAGFLLVICSAFNFGAAPGIIVVLSCILLPAGYSLVLYRKGI